MIYHRTCALEGCEVEFDTEMERKKYCCTEHYVAGNRKGALERQRNTREHGKFKCPCCGEMKSDKKYCFCRACKENIQQRGIVDTVAMEHRCIA